MKIAINKCYGGFELSSDAVKYLIEKNSDLVKCKSYSDYCGGRLDSALKDEFVSERFADVGDGFFTDGLVLYNESGNVVWTEDSRSYENRTHPDLIEVVEKLGSMASSRLSNIKIIEIPDGIEYEIDEYDGIESVHEKHQSWY